MELTTNTPPLVVIRDGKAYVEVIANFNGEPLHVLAPVGDGRFFLLNALDRLWPSRPAPKSRRVSEFLNV